MLNTLHNTDNGTVVYYNNAENQSKAAMLCESAASWQYTAADTIQGQYGDKLFRIVYTEKFIILSYSNIVRL